MYHGKRNEAFKRIVAYDEHCSIASNSVFKGIVRVNKSTLQTTS